MPAASRAIAAARRRSRPGGCARELAGVALEEVGVELAGEERRMREDPREELAVGDEAGHPGLARARARSSCARLAARRRVRDDLAEHRVVVDADLAAGDDADVGAHASTARRRRAACRSSAGSRARGPRRTAGPRSPSRAAAARVGSRARSPRAIRICSRTRSRPVVSSVTGCSTWRRVLTSRK